MKQELETMLVEKYPEIFQTYKKKFTCMQFGFECGDGWVELIDKLCENISKISKKYKIQVTAAQVKEKFGGLRFYYDISSTTETTKNIEKVYSQISDIVHKAEYDSFKICEQCGKPAELRNVNGWRMVNCYECFSKIKAKELMSQ